MSFIVVFVVTVVALFAAAFFSKRRFGVLGLGLAAGAILSSLWVGDLTPVVERAGVVISQPPLQLVVAGALILLPALLLFINSPTYQHTNQRIIGSIAFAVLAAAFLFEPFKDSLVVDATGKPVYDFLAEYGAYIITSGLLFALADLMFVKMPKIGKEHGKH